MAEIMLRVFGSKLLTAPVDADEEVHPRLGDKIMSFKSMSLNKNLTPVFSPEQLKFKIIVKGKKLKSDNPESGEVSDEDESAESGNLEIEPETTSTTPSQSSDSGEKKKKKKNVSFFTLTLISRGNNATVRSRP